MTKILCAVLIADAVWLLAGGPGIFVGNSQDTLVFAIFLPTLFRHWRGLAVIPLLAIIYVPGFSSKAIVALHACLLHPWLVLPCAVAYWLDPQDIQQQRLDFWGPYLEWWTVHANHMIGTGPGSFEWVVWSIGLDRQWLHNDWLQILFEFGWLGLSQALVLYVWALARTRGRSRRVLVALGFGMLMYSPLQFFLVQFLIVSEVISTERN